jgi:hypothetical protein
VATWVRVSTGLQGRANAAVDRVEREAVSLLFLVAESITTPLGKTLTTFSRRASEAAVALGKSSREPPYRKKALAL